jgi:hypothetical protein
MDLRYLAASCLTWSWMEVERASWLGLVASGGAVFRPSRRMMLSAPAAGGGWRLV